MFDFNEFNFDIDGDGVNDTLVQDSDLDGDGVADGFRYLIDADGDGVADTIYEEYDMNRDGAVDTVYGGMDTNGDGIIDTAVVEQDTNFDGYTDEVTTAYDYDGDGVFDEVVSDTDAVEPEYSDYDENTSTDYTAQGNTVDLDGDGIDDAIVNEADADGDGDADGFQYLIDADGDGVVDTIYEEYDMNGDGYTDTTFLTVDSNGDGFFEAEALAADTDFDGTTDIASEGSYIDSDGDGVADTYMVGIDEDYDGTFDAVEVYKYDADTGAIEFIPLDETGLVYNDGLIDIENFDPETANPDDVLGDPGESMEHWEHQGDTGRCALYSQLFVIEELTGQEIDIEDLVDVAEENGWFSEEGGTSINDINKILDYYEIENEMSFGNDINDIIDVLENDGKVIVTLDSDEIWYQENSSLYSPDDAADHAVQVIGIDYSDPDNPMVILNDSGHHEGCGEMVPLDDFIDAWEDGDCQMIAVM